MTSDLLDVAPVGASEYAEIEDLCRHVIGTHLSTLVFPGEATVALEAAARGLGRPGGRALNLVTGPYGATFGDWLAEAGSAVENLTTPFDQAVTADQVRSALERLGPVDVVSLVHAEAATGVVNDLAAISGVAKRAGALVVVDAVASIGAEPVAIDAWDLDLVVLSAQKALAGPAGVSIVSLSSACWGALAGHPAPWRGSALSLLDWRERWLAPGRAALPVIPAHLETRALGAAMGRVASEGLGKVVARHRAAAAATRAALVPLGLELWARQPAEAASVATLVRAPAQGAAALVQAALSAWSDGVPPVTVAPGSLAPQAVRVNHTGRRAALAPVWASVGALAGGLQRLGYAVDLGAALTAAGQAWEEALA